MELQDTIKSIKAQLRLYMNGAVSQSMRQHGISYKLNFGIELPRIKEIASMYSPDHSLAQALWKENIRECKILAGILQPKDSFFPEIADIWVESIDQQEIAELTCMHLFQHLPYASEKAFQWIADERCYFQVCGFLLLARLFMHNALLNERSENEFLDQAFVVLQKSSTEYFSAQAAYTALCIYVRNHKREAEKILSFFSSFEKSSDLRLQTIYKELELEAADL